MNPEETIFEQALGIGTSPAREEFLRALARETKPCCNASRACSAPMIGPADSSNTTGLRRLESRLPPSRRAKAPLRRDGGQAARRQDRLKPGLQACSQRNPATASDVTSCFRKSAKAAAA